MATRNINLTAHFDRFISGEVNSGRYGNASEVVREGPRLMELRKEQNRVKLRLLRAAVREGVEQIEQGSGLEFASIGDLERHIDQLEKEAVAFVRKRRPA